MFTRLNLIGIILILNLIFIQPSPSGVLIDSDTIANITEKVSPSVVNIDSSVVSASNEKKNEALNFGGVELNIPNLIEPPHSGTGSGIILKEDGYILTNYHVVKQADKINITLQNGKKYEAKLVSKDSYSDLAILKIDEKNLPVAKFGDSKNLRPGEWVIAIGSPLGLEHTVTHGIISAISRHVGVTYGAAQGAFKYIQTDTPINPGNSGGPLLNLNGEVIGLNTFIIGKNAQNLNFAIPSNYVKEIAENLIKDGSIKHSYLGIKMSFLDESILKANNLNKDTKGVYVIQVVPESPAEISGIQTGDIIQKVNGDYLEDPKMIAEIVRVKKVGDKLNFKILRSGETKNIVVIVGELPDLENLNKPNKN